MAGKAPEDRAERGKRLALTRSNARLAAVQALYQWEATGTRAESIIKEFADHRLGEVVDDVALPPADLKLFTTVVLGAASNVAELDDTEGGTRELGLEVLGFAPVDGDTRLLIGHQRRGRW